MKTAIEPGSTANKRLFDARTHWVRALEAYFSPEGFRIEINACIQALRNVTFALQADKSHIPNFERWYSTWQLKMRSDVQMKWSVDARNTIVKSRDLELHSKLRATLVGSYLDSENLAIQTDYSPRITIKRIISEFKKKEIHPDYLKHAHLKIERRWVINDFPTREFLDLLAYCWTFLSRVLTDLPSARTGSPPAEGLGLPPCMIDDGEYRSISFKLSTGEISVLDTIPIEIQTINKSNPQNLANLREKYGLSDTATSAGVGGDLRDQAMFFFNIAKNMLRVDGHHVFIVMLFTHDKKVIMLELHPEDQSDKYRIWNAIASEVKRTKAHSLICISEAWTATIAPDQPFQHAAEAPNRGEALHLIAASANGSGLTLAANFSRMDTEIVIQGTEEYSLDSVNTIAPVLAAWNEMAEARKRGG